MRYFKVEKDGYILTIGNGYGASEISESEYTALYETFMNRPTHDRYIYSLRADTLEWEQTGEYPEEYEEVTEADYQNAH